MNRKRQNAYKRNIQSRADQLVHQICAVSDPFCHHAVGAKSPAVTDVGTYHFQHKQIVPVVTGDTGWAFVVVNGGGSASDLFSKVAVDTSTSLTFTNPNKPATPIITEDDNGDSLVRIVSSGVEIYDIAPATAAGGDIIVHEINNVEDIAGDSHDVSKVVANLPHLVCDRRKGATWASRRGYEGELFHTVGTNHKERTSCLIAISGEASSTVASIVITLHYEIQPTFGFSTLHTSTSNKGRVSNTAQSLSNKILQNSAPIVEGGKKAFSAWLKAKAKQYAGKAIKAASSAIGGYIGGPAGGAVGGYLADQIPELD